MSDKYVPPVQKRFGQLVDSLFLLVLVYLSLLAPLLLNAPERQVAPAVSSEAVTWQDLNQNATMAAQWQKLGYEAAKAKPVINNKFHYVIKPGSLILTIAVIVGYFVLVLRISDKEYRQVIAERFGRKDGQGPPAGQ